MWNNHKKVLLILGAIFGLIYAWPTISVTWPAMRSHQDYYISSWPDSMANYFFVDQLANHNSLSYEEPLNFLAMDQVQPRSVNIFNHRIVPTGFLGFILLLGVLTKLIGMYAILLVTPLLAVLGVFAFYGLVKNIYDERVAFWSAVLLFILPPFWYYASLPMLPNILFLSLSIIAYYFYFKQIEARGYAYGLISGLLFGLALIIRPMEFVWIGVLLLIPVIINREHFKIKRALVFAVGVLLPIIILLAVNQKLYSNVFYVGYLNLEPSKGSGVINRLPPALATNLSSWLAYPKLILAPFGLHPRLVIHNFNNYFLKLLWPWCLLLLFGLAVAWRQSKIIKLSRAQKIYAWSSLTAGILMIIYYGSWLFDDKLTLRLNTIGLSYVRYWLPLYLLILPIAAYGLNKIIQFFKNGVARTIGLVVVCILLFVFSFFAVYLKSGDGLRDQTQVTHDNYQLLEAVKALVNKETVIVCDREDKILFPQYSVVVYNGNNLIWPGVKNIIGKRPIYYLSQSDNSYIEKLKEQLKENKLTLEFFSKVNDKFVLYTLKNLN